MAAPHRSLRRLAPILGTAVLPALALAGCEEAAQSTLDPASDFARTIDGLFKLTLYLGYGVFAVVAIVMVTIVIRFRRREGNEQPAHVHGNTRLEIAWTLLPAVILAVIAVPTVRTIFATQRTDPPPGSLDVRVVGHQWWWEFEYPDYGFVTANELHLPVGVRTTFSLESADVIHSFWIPRLGGKRDVVPGRTNYLWFAPDSVGTFLGQCAEFCGTAHARMGLRAIVHTPQKFEDWVRRQQRPARAFPAAGAAAAGPAVPPPAGAGTPETPTAVDTAGLAAAMRDTSGGRDGLSGPRGAQNPGRTDPATVGAPEEVREGGVPAGADTAPGGAPEAAAAGPAPGDTLAWRGGVVGDAARGAALFQRSACVACHAIGGTVAKGRIGPDLTHVGSRERIAAELLPNTPQNMARWLANPPAIKPGALMPSLNLKPDQIADLVAYLESLQ